jgi:hypothetical protein
VTASRDSNQEGRKGGIQETNWWKAPREMILPAFLTSCLPEFLPSRLGCVPVE